MKKYSTGPCESDGRNVESACGEVVRKNTEPSKYLEDIFKDMYRAEHERRDKFPERVFSLSPIVIGLVVGAGYCGRNLPFFTYDVRSVLLWGSFAAILLGIALALVFFLKVFYPRGYGYISYPSDIYQYALDLGKHHNSVGCPDKAKQVENDLRAFLTSDYAKYATLNRRQNEQKSACLYQGYLWIAMSVFLLLFSLFPLFMIQRSTPEIQKVEIVNPIKTVQGDVLPAGEPLGRTQATQGAAVDTSPVETRTSAEESTQGGTSTSQEERR